MRKERRDDETASRFRKQNVPLDDLTRRPAGRAEAAPDNDPETVTGLGASQASYPVLFALRGHAAGEGSPSAQPVTVATAS